MRTRWHHMTAATRWQSLAISASDDARVNHIVEHCSTVTHDDLDRARRRPMLMASAAGGMDIEQVAEETPEKILTVHIEPALGVKSYHSRYLAAGMDLPRELWRDFHNIVSKVFRVIS